MSEVYGCKACAHWKRFMSNDEVVKLSDRDVPIVRTHGICSYLTDAFRNGLDVHTVGGEYIATVWPSTNVSEGIATHENFQCSKFTPRAKHSD